MRAIIGSLLAVFVTLPALAQDLPGRREAMRMVFAADAPVESVVFPHESLSAAEAQLLSAAMEQGLMPQMVFYGALAISPDEGLANAQTTIAVGDFHDEVSASEAALARCNEARAEDSADCVVVLIVRPEGWEADALLQLSASAAEALRTEFRRAGRPRVFATSSSTGQYGIGPSLEAALAACGVSDCRAVIADD